MVLLGEKTAFARREETFSQFDGVSKFGKFMLDLWRNSAYTRESAELLCGMLYEKQNMPTVSVLLRWKDN